jgi:GDPmannose 4,6-dehydratase
MNDSQKKVLVSGVTGQDGSYMVDYLLANTPHLVYGMVRRTAKPDLSNLSLSINNPRFQLVVGDLSDTTSIDNVVRQIKPDYFVNLAAQSFVKSSWDIPEMTFDVGATGVLRCLEAIRKHTPQCRFYNAGSSEEYGDVISAPQDESHPLRPRSPYGAAKAAARHIVKVYRESYGLYAVQGLLFNHESERRGEEFLTRKVTLGVARIAAAIKSGKPFEPLELGNLDAKRDWSHAEDFVDGIWRMLNQEAYPSGKPLGTSWEEHTSLWIKNGWKPHEYVLASGETHTIRSFVEKAFKAAGIDAHWSFAGTVGQLVPAENEVYRQNILTERTVHGGVLVRINPAFYRPAEVEILMGDSTRAREELGWKPKVSFDELVQRMVKSDLAAVGINL